MKFNIFKKGFSLTELLIVLVIIAVLFAALAPIMTKRKQGDASANEPVWSFVTNAKDAFFDPGAEKLTSAAYFGFNPSSISDYKPYAKVYLRAKSGQNHIQFRYGDNYGNLTGLFSMDDNNNIITSTRPSDTNNFSSRGARNTVAGAFAYTKWTGNNDMIAIGASSAASPKNATSGNIAVGANSAQYLTGSNNIFLGANTGRTTSALSDTVAVGGRVLSLDESSGKSNVFIGYGVATSGFRSVDAEKNTIVASTMYGTTAHNNTIIGYKVYDANFGISHDITAVGYNSCNSINMTNALISRTSTEGPKTCIGVDSADNYGNGTGTPGVSSKSQEWSFDPFDHVFIGGKPYQFNGRSVLEVHNMDSSQAPTSTYANPRLGPTVVLNSHLVVRGNLFFPEVSSGDLVAHESAISGVSDKTEQGRDRCGKECLGVFQRRKYRDKKKCYSFNKFFQALGNFLVGYVLGGVIMGTFAAMNDWFFGDPSDYKRGRDPISGSVMLFTSGKGCTNNHGYYPNQTTYCPNLGLSDIRLKENITENTDALDKIMYVMPYNYTYKNDTAKIPQVGVIAQDLKVYLPDSVKADENGYLSIKWDGIFYATINSLKKIDKQITLMEDDVSELETASAEISKKQKSTQKRIDELNKRIVKLENK